MVPHLTTALTGPINELEQRVLESMPAIERWFRLEWMEHTPPFYSSVDLRNAGFKLAPVATDLFPSSFNYLTPQMLPLAVQAAMAAIEKICPEAKNLLLLPDHRLHDSFYLDGLQRLVQIFNQAGLNVRLGELPDMRLAAGDEGSTPQARTLVFSDGTELPIEPLVRNRGRLGLKDFDPCTVLLNNDLAGGVPRSVQHLHEQYVLPPLHAGWTVRRKSRNFASYEEVAKKFAKLLGMDPWLINPFFASCGQVNPRTPAGLDAVCTQVEAVLAKVRRKFKDYGINEKPFVVLKANNSRDGLGILTLHDTKDTAALAQRLTERFGPLCSAGNGEGSHQGDREGEGEGEHDTLEIIVQEGVPTMERLHSAVAEPVVVMIDRYVVGGYYRVHAGRAPDEDLCGPGSSYMPLAFAESGQLPRPGAKAGASAPNRFYMYGVIGRLAMLAAAYELEATDPEAEADA
jgi:glutamate--cysteine ligase